MGTQPPFLNEDQDLAYNAETNTKSKLTYTWQH